MPKAPDIGREILTTLIADLTELRRQPPRDRIQAILPLLNRASADTCVESRLAAVRSYAARDAVAEAGSQTALAAQLGITPQRISTIVSGITSRNRKTRARRMAEQDGAVGELNSETAVVGPARWQDAGEDLCQIPDCGCTGGPHP